MAQLRQHLDDLEALNTQVLIISFSAPSAAQSWLKETGVPFPLLLDPGRTVYRIYAWNARGGVRGT
jgi:peroxiredoxin